MTFQVRDDEGVWDEEQPCQEIFRGMLDWVVKRMLVLRELELLCSFWLDCVGVKARKLSLKDIKKEILFNGEVFSWKKEVRVLGVLGKDALMY